MSMYICYCYKEQSCIGSGMSNYMVKSHKKSVFLCRMVLEWREREHEDVDREFLDDLNAQKALKCVGCTIFGILGV